MVKKIGDLSGKELLIFFLPSFLIIIVGFITAYQFVEPSPPRTLSIAAGEKGGAYYKFSNTYKTLLKQEGVTLVVRETEGSAENLALLGEKTDGVDIAFIQGGVGNRSGSNDIFSIGSLYYEPLWVFLRPGLKLTKASQLKGLTLAVGEKNSGTRILTTALLGASGITEENTRFLSATTRESADLLLKGSVDIACFVSTHWSSQVNRLLKSEGVTLMGFDRAEAYAMRFKYLNVIRIPQGVVDFERNIPDRDIRLISPTAQLAIRSDLHPALIDLVLQTAKRVHRKGGLFEAEGEFPSAKLLNFELSSEAQRFYHDKTPFLQRYFPFWVANLLSRIKVMILPFIAIVYPLFKLMPFFYRWRMRSRIYRWYSDLDRVGTAISNQDDSETFEDSMTRLEEIEKRVANIKVPEPYAEGLFHLRMHIDMFRRRLQDTRKNSSG